METVVLPHLAGHPLRLGLFEDVANAAFLRRQLLEGNADFEYAFLDAAVLLSRTHVMAASFRAINSMVEGQMKSKNVHSEVVFCLSSNNNIAESFRRFGISDDTTTIVAIKIGGDAASVDEHLARSIAGACTQLTDERLQSIHDSGRIKKAYKVDLMKDGLRASEAFVLGSMALRGS